MGRYTYPIRELMSAESAAALDALCAAFDLEPRK